MSVINRRLGAIPRALLSCDCFEDFGVDERRGGDQPTADDQCDEIRRLAPASTVNLAATRKEYRVQGQTRGPVSRAYPGRSVRNDMMVLSAW